MPFWKPLNWRILTFILTFLTGLSVAGKVSNCNVWSANLDLGTLTIKVGDGTWSLTGTNGGSIGEGKKPAGEVDLDVGKGLDTLELILLVGDLAPRDSGLLYKLLLNNGFGMTPLLIDGLLADGLNLLPSVSQSHLSQVDLILHLAFMTDRSHSTELTAKLTF